MDAMQHVSLRNSTVLVRGDDETVAYALGEMHHTFGAGGNSLRRSGGSRRCSSLLGRRYTSREAHFGNSEAVWVNGEMVRDKDLALGDEIRVGGVRFSKDIWLKISRQEAKLKLGANLLATHEFHLPPCSWIIF